MRTLEEICDRITKAREYYDQCKLSLIADQSKILRSLSVSHSELSELRIEYYNQWLDIYNSAEGSNAAKERVADTEVRELYLTRKIMDSTKLLIDTVRSTISAAKQSS